MRVFIAGATGVLGRRMVRQFTQKDHRVVGLARDENGKQTIERLGGDAIFGNIFDVDSMARAVKPDPSAHYEMLESVSFAFLLALELLTPTQRAVLLLRDVFDFNVGETGEILQLSEPNIKTTHHRARRVMREYEEKRFVPHRSLVEKTGQVVAQLVEFLTKRDTEGAAKLLAANVVCLSDGGGEVFAARVPVVGRSKVSLFLSNLLQGTSAFTSRTRSVELNGLFAMATERDNASPGYAKKVATLFQINDEGRIDGIYVVMASRKLAAVPAASEVEK